MIRTSQTEAKATEAAIGKRNVVCWNEDPQAQAIRIELQTGKFFVLPVSHFLSAEFASEKNGDILVVTFSTHQATLRGRRLREIALAFQKFAVESIKEIATKYASLADPKAPLILSIEIAATGNSALADGE
ncbi:MAG: hypothetical protein ABI680_10075 [Chthoniobacteraceae bacterium]